MAIGEAPDVSSERDDDRRREGCEKLKAEALRWAETWALLMGLLSVYISGRVYERFNLTSRLDFDLRL